ncbi:hypothetical protein ACLKA6_012035 [Drosophila palustris]
MSDCWKAYNCLAEEGFIHQTSIVLQHQQQLDHIFGRPVLHSCSATPAAYACSATAAAATTAAALAGEAGGAT